MSAITDINFASQKILQGEPLIYKTETFLALGGDAFNSHCVEQIFALKQRPKHKPLSIIVGSFEQFGELANPSTDLFDFVKIFWPGPMTVLVKLSGAVPNGIKNYTGFTAVRLSSHVIAQSLCLLCGKPIVATSANISGGIPAKIYSELDKKIVHIPYLDLGVEPAGGLPSTIVSYQNGYVNILRQGAISAESIKNKGFLLGSLK